MRIDYEKLCALSPIGMALYDLTAGDPRLMFANQAFLSLGILEEGQMENEEGLTICFADFLTEALTGKPPQENSLFLPSSRRWCRVWVEKRETGQGIVYGIEDTSSKQWETALRRAHPDLLFVFTKEGICKKSYTLERERLYASRNIQGIHIKELLPKEVSSRALEAFFACLNENKPVTFEYSLVHEGLTKWYEARIAPLDANQVLAVVREVTTQWEAKEQLQFQSMILDQIEDHVSVTDERGVIQYVNAIQCRTFNREQEDLLGKPISIFASENSSLEPQYVVDQAVKKGSYEGYVENEDALGQRFFFYCRSKRFQSWKDQKFYVISTLTNLTEQKRLEELRFIEGERFRAILLSMGEGVIATDDTGSITLMNTMAEKLTGCEKERAVGRSLSAVYEVFDAEGRPKQDPVFSVLQDPTVLQRNSEGILFGVTRLEIEESASPIFHKDGRVLGVVIVFRDMTEKKAEQRRVEYLSYHDHLTEVFNRRYLEKTLKELDAPEYLSLGILSIDVNGLKLTNDVFGHETGDKLLKKVVQVVNAVKRPQDIFGRVGGDEFLLILPKTEEKEMEVLCQEIEDEITRTSQDTLQLSLALGYAVKKDRNTSLKDVIMKADDHMYKTKLRHGQAMRQTMLERILARIHEKYALEKIHTDRVSMYCEALANALDLSQKEVQNAKVAGFLHDVGMILVSERILNKADFLTKEETQLIKRHPETGYQILRCLDEYQGLAFSVLHHHERYDGTGYPAGLKQEEIPLLARIISICDAYEAMTGHRPYRKTKSKAEAIQELQDHAKTQFDPFLVEVFVQKVLPLEK